MTEDQEQLLDEIIADYLEAEESGHPPDPETLIAAHPDLADELRQFFENLGQVQALADPLVPPQVMLERIRYFGDYELLEEIARGGMGIVYKARQTSLNRIVAVKLILSGHLASETDVKRFQTEAESAANLQHPHIVAVHEVGRHQGQNYFSMDYIDGKNLSEIVRENPLPPKQAAGYVREIAEAIHYAHQQGTLHRDLKPSNVLIDQNDRVQITDFGLAMKVEGDSELTRTGQVLGTPSYMPPEQAQHKRSLIGPGSDIYAIGAVLYELLTGRPPFQSDSAVETLRQVIETEPLSPRLLNPAVPKDLETICLKCLEKEPHKRYATAQHLADDLGRFLQGEPIQARPIGRMARAWRWCKRKPVVAGLSSLLALSLISLNIAEPPGNPFVILLRLTSLLVFSLFTGTILSLFILSLFIGTTFIRTTLSRMFPFIGTTLSRMFPIESGQNAEFYHNEFQRDEGLLDEKGRLLDDKTGLADDLENAPVGQKKQKYSRYREVPFYRKQAFFWIMLFVFPPLSIAILLFGDVYYLTDDGVQSFGIANRIVAGILAVFYIVAAVQIALERNVATPESQAETLDTPKPKDIPPSDSAADMLDQAIKHYRGDGVPRDLEQSFKLCKRAYEGGDAEAARFLGTFYEDGVGVEKDLDRARELYAEAADQGFVLANYNLGNLLFRQGRIDEALARWAQGAQAGDAYSIVSLGLCYQEGTGVEQDLDKAIRLFRHAAEGGNSEAMIRLAILYRDGAGVERDAAKMNELLEKARELNHPFAWYELGRQMLQGNETPDEVRASPAIEYFEKSAELGQPEAMEFCAEIYCMCSQPDYEKGLPYLQAAVAAESPRAKYVKAILLASGKGMKQDLPAAYALCEQAAQAGESDAQRMLAIMLERGDGVEPDLEAAKQWYQTAADNGDPQAAERLKELTD